MPKYEKCIDMMAVLERIAPLSRTLASYDTDLALKIVQEYLPNSKIKGFKCGSKAWSWTIPLRWEVEKATICADGEVIVDVDWHILHLLNYSIPFSGKVSREELLTHLYSYPEKPDLIPFVFSFYQPKWGFCIPHNWMNKFTHDYYDIDIVTRFEDGDMNVLEYFLPGESEETIVFCNDICHPSQANDSLTGVVAAMDIMVRLSKNSKRKYSYLFLAVPETIGSIAYLSRHPDVIKKSVFGIVCEMLGTDGQLVGQCSRNNEYLDFIVEQVLKENGSEYKTVPFLKSVGNDEKSLDIQGVNIPTISLTRYPYYEYHSSGDNVDLISENRLAEGRDVLQGIVDYLEKDYVVKMKHPGPVFLSGYDLYPDWRSDPKLEQYWLSFLDVMYGIDDKHSIIELAMINNIPMENFFYWTDAFIGKHLAIGDPYVASNR